MTKRPLVSIVIPAFNELQSLLELLPQVLAQVKDAEIIVVDDGSSDSTCHQLKHLPIKVIALPQNRGNGAAIKAGVRQARGKFLIIMDADGQHQPQDIPKLLLRLQEGYDLVIGWRDVRSHASLPRRLANCGFNFMASFVVGKPVKDLTSGFRAARTKVFKEFLHLLPNGFSTPSTSTMAFFRAGYSVYFEPIVALKRQGKSHIKPLTDGLRFLLIIYKITVLYAPLKVFFPFAFLVGLLGILTKGMISAIFISSAILIFLIGLMSEQITMLLYQEKQLQHDDTD